MSERAETNQTTIYEDFENGNAFKSVLNLDKDIKRSVMFENGKQWNMDDDIKDFPKITLNIIKQIGKTRQSNIMQNEYAYLINSTNFKNIRKVQDFLKYLAEVTKIKFQDLKALRDDYTKGTAIGYFYWDAEKRGFLRNSGGEMRYEVIDIRNFVVANPYIQGLQEQEWVIYNTREKINSIKKKYGKDLQLIPDGLFYTKDTEKIPNALDIDNDLVNVYTKFYRNEEGQVFFKIATQTLVLQEAKPLNPFYEKKDKKEQPNTTSLMDIKEKELEDVRSGYIWNLYPFAKLSLNERDNCFYGYPITLEYIEAQKSINNHFSVYDKALQDNVLGGWVFRKGLLDAQELTTESGQMLELDLRPNESIQNVFGRLPIAQVPADSAMYSQTLMGTTREVAGSSNVMIGKADHAGQSGKQTQMLLQRAQENASDNAVMFNEFKKEQAYIMFLFAKFFYDNEEFVLTNHGADKDETKTYLGNDAFDGREYLEDNVFINIKVGTSAAFSEYTNVEMLGMMVQSGQLPAEAYITMLPEGMISNRQELLEILEQNTKKIMEEQEKKIQEQQQVMEQMAKAYEETEKMRNNSEKLVNDNDRLRDMVLELSAKTIDKMAKSAEQTNKVTAEMQKVLEIMQKQNKKN